MTALKKGSIENVFSAKKKAAPAPLKVGKTITKFTFDLPTVAKKQLALMSIEMDKSQKDLLAEAINDLFEKYGKPTIAA